MTLGSKPPTLISLSSLVSPLQSTLKKTTKLDLKTFKMSRLMAAFRKDTPSNLLKNTFLSPPTPPISPKPSQQNPQIRFHSSSSSSHYMNQLYPKSNSSFNLSSGNSLQSDVVRLSQNVYLVDSGIGTPRTCLQDELIRPQNQTRFQNRVGFLNQASTEPPINKQLLERFFIDLIAGDSVAKQRATSRFNDLSAGFADMNAVVSGEPLLVLPRRYRQKRAWMELSKNWRSNSQVKGFVVGRVRGGYAVAIAGYVAYLPFRPHLHARRMRSDRFTIESINSKTGFITVI